MTIAPPCEIARSTCNGADRVVRPYKRLSGISVWDLEDAVPYEICHCEERSDAAIRSPQLKETDSHASDTVTGSE